MNTGGLEWRVGMSVRAWSVSALRGLWDVCGEALEGREMEVAMEKRRKREETDKEH